MRIEEGGHHDRVVTRAIIEQRPTVRARALVTAGIVTPIDDEHCRSIIGRLDHVRSLERHATLFALGMAGSPTLRSLAESEDAAVRRGAQWWLEQGSAIRDADTSGATH